ncbi:MAG: hypothetical protein GX238_08675 [Epulopiscium sp.]|mgnify:CR=1 FL=1|nr:hypothetical protein [Candidatus Epulonipiscium sp.]
MFFWKKRKKTHFSMEELKYSKVPILVLDKLWHDIFSSTRKTKQIMVLETNLNNLIKKQGQLTNDRKDYIKLKKRMMKEILELTSDAYELENEQAKDKMVKNQQYVLEINEKIEQMDEQLKLLPGEIQRANGELLEESVKICYAEMRAGRKEMKELNERIEHLRTELKECLDKKTINEENVEQLYSYLHHLVGADFIEKLDQEYWG